MMFEGASQEDAPLTSMETGLASESAAGATPRRCCLAALASTRPTESRPLPLQITANCRQHRRGMQAQRKA